jgi:hypothetical protein
MKIFSVLLLSCLLFCSCYESSTVCNENQLKRFDGLGEKVRTTALLSQYTYEPNDGDIHLVLNDGGCTLVAELMIGTEAWSKFFMKFNPTEAPKKANVEITVTGLRYYDQEHGVTGAALNCVEIHPVLNFSIRGE